MFWLLVCASSLARKRVFHIFFPTTHVVHLKLSPYTDTATLCPSLYNEQCKGGVDCLRYKPLGAPDQL